MPAHRLSARQTLILRFVAQQLAERGYPPTLREICRECSISSTSVASYHLSKLVGLDLLERTEGASRGLRITPAGADALGISDPRDTLVAVARRLLDGRADTHELAEAVEACEVAA